MITVDLSDAEIDQVQRIVHAAAEQHATIADPEFLLKATPLSHELPRRLRETLNTFRLHDDGYGALLIRGFPIDEAAIGPTPLDWAGGCAPSPTLRPEMFLALCGTLLGDLVAWSSEQNGHLIHNVLPIKEHEISQLGWGSDVEFICHVEDAFSPYSPDYLGLMCMRNPEETGTNISAVADLDLDALDVDALFGENFAVRPDDAHLTQDEDPSRRDAHLDISHQNRLEEIRNPKKTAIFFGDRRSPYIRLDPPYMSAIGGPSSKKAFDGLMASLQEHKQQCRLHPGDILLIDNFRVVHGREAFKARYDGTDRWLKRIKVTRDLRKSRTDRPSASSRLVI